MAHSLARTFQKAVGDDGDALAAVKQLTEARGLTGFAQPVELEQAMLDVWALSEGSSPDRLAA